MRRCIEIDNSQTFFYYGIITLMLTILFKSVSVLLLAIPIVDVVNKPEVHKHLFSRYLDYVVLYSNQENSIKMVNS